ncbi:UxaA family hydrolase [Candidatus Pantoea soli]|uniref:Altronate hydrolase n=1 Tax=Candidatus Pantoea soli TaxID=3098669 RepID=A0A518XJM4_9GAMM|nr:UxaA family hydrolase [Pantoea soli]QDY44375.1 altronate hydrolase [Pantoea soli]
MTSQYLLASANDNVAIVTRNLAKGELIALDGQALLNRQRILPGHRLCVKPIARGEALISWDLPFGTAMHDIQPGDYICNQVAKDVLRIRHPEDYDSSLVVNFSDRDTVSEQILPDRPQFGRNQVDVVDEAGFDGVFRGDQRGWGTRNYLVLIGVTSQARAAVLAACKQLQPRWPASGAFDGVVAIVHTEGGGLHQLNNQALLLRTLAGFATNPNVGAAILVNAADSRIDFAEIEHALVSRDLPAAEYRVDFHQLLPGEAITELVAQAEALIPGVQACQRRRAPLSGLRIGLQCGGSDAFSGVTANQVLGRCVQQLIRCGGSANLAETDELIGAEQYVLQRVASQQLFDRWLAVQQRFKDYAAAHGHTAEGNVSGGNLYRGLYNITLKSIGAARKKDPATYIDHIIEYGEPMHKPGYYFMDSPGNDLESIAGQVAAGANLILFTTGNGSITNFPFVPTLKIVTTHERFQLLESDMDFDAGQVLSGESFDHSADRLFSLLRQTASGQRSKGEYTGQYQTQIWRDAYFPASFNAAQANGQVGFGSGAPLVPANQNALAQQVTGRSVASVAMILPTSLCSGQVAEQIAYQLNHQRRVASEVVALPHTEGCAVSGGDAEVIFCNTLIGYATHPLVHSCVFLEHGCEKTHNDFFRQKLVERGVDSSRFAWASIQQEGGIQRVTQHVMQAVEQAPQQHASQASPLLIGFASQLTKLNDNQAQVLSKLVTQLLAIGVGVVIAAGDALLQHPAFLAEEGTLTFSPTVAYSGAINQAGLHVMDTSSSDWLEIATGLGATGCRALIALSARTPLQPHRFIPTLQLCASEQLIAGAAPHFDCVLSELALPQLLDHIAGCLAGSWLPQQRPAANVGFQISRGRYGVSL